MNLEIGGWGGSFEAGCLLTFPTFRVGAALTCIRDGCLIEVWHLIEYTVDQFVQFTKSKLIYLYPGLL